MESCKHVAAEISGAGLICKNCGKTLDSWSEIEKPQGIPPFDPVQKPRHYNVHPSGIQCIEVTRHMGFNVGNAIKYLWRADEKGAAVQDLEKAVWHIQDEIALREGEKRET